MQKNSYPRGQRPARPGDLTARVFAENQKRAEAAKKAGPVDVEKVRSAALREGIDAGWDAGYDAGFEAGTAAAAAILEDAGIDVDAAVLARVDAEGDKQ